MLYYLTEPGLLSLPKLSSLPHLTHCTLVTPKLCTFTNSEDPDEMPHNAAFHLGLHCLLRQKQTSEKDIKFYLEIITCDPLIFTMNHPKLYPTNLINH